MSVSSFAPSAAFPIKMPYSERLSQDEERNLFERVRNGDLEAREILLEHGLPIVVHVLRGMNCSKVDMDDLFQNASIALLKAIDDYDPALTPNFSTFAFWRIKRAVFDSFIEAERPAYISPFANRSLHRIKLYIKENSSGNKEFDDKFQDVEYMSTIFTDISKEQLGLLLPIAVSSLKHRYTVATSSPEINMLKSVDGAPDELAEKAERLELLFEALSTLDKRDRKILELRYGLLDGKERSWTELSTEFGITPPRLRQLERRGLECIRNSKYRDSLLELY